MAVIGLGLKANIVILENCLIKFDVLQVYRPTNLRLAVGTMSHNTSCTINRNLILYTGAETEGDRGTCSLIICLGDTIGNVSSTILS